MPAFALHWSRVIGTTFIVPIDAALFALWPSPVNADECFAAAGFTDFADTDDAWEAATSAVQERLLAELSAIGTPRLLSEPLTPRSSALVHLFRTPAPFPLADQVALPMQWDSCPDCIVKFGDGGVSLRTGSGHTLFWVTLPVTDHPADDAPPALFERVAMGHTLVHTTLDWTPLVPK